MSSQDTEENRKRVHSRLRSACIFRETIFVFPCIIESATSDSWGVRLGLCPVDRNGFIYPEQTQLDISVAWGWGLISELVWCGGQAGGWTVYFDETLCQSLREVASEVSGLEPIDRWRRLADHINDWELQHL